jgi:hypothetical protein
MPAGTLVTTDRLLGSQLVEYAMAWLSDGAGAVSGNEVEVRAGYLRSLKTMPGGAASAPDALYDLTILDEDGVDLLAGQGLDRSATLGELVLLDPPVPYAGGLLRPTIAHAGAANAGVVTLLVGGRP